MRYSRAPRAFCAGAVLAAAAACAPQGPAGPRPDAAGLPPIPRAEGPLAIRVVHPTPTTPRPAVDSTFVYGSVGRGDATLTVDGHPVEVEPNGAFLAWVPVPASGAYELVARADGRTARATAAYRSPAPTPVRTDTGVHSPEPPPPAASAAPAEEAFAGPLSATVAGAEDTLATGSGVAIGRPTPTGAYRWFLPRGARLTAVDRRGEMVQVRLDAGTTAWFPAADLALGGPAPAASPAPLGPVSVRPAEGWVDVRVPAGGAPFLVEPGDGAWHVTLYGVSAARAETVPGGGDAALTEVRTAPATDERSTLELRFAREPWGYKAFYESDGTLVLRLRRPPRIDPARPLAGIRVAIDPGHPPGGATGPTGLTEADANLAISLPLAEMLRERGAEVLLTRTTGDAVGLASRPEQAVRWGADLLVSVHNNAFPEGINPFRNAGTSTYFFHPFSAPLARALNGEIVEVARIPDLGAKQGNLALVRPTWMPTALTESLYMLLPRHEAALRDPAFVRRLAAAHARGIERFLRERAGR